MTLFEYITHLRFKLSMSEEKLFIKADLSEQEIKLLRKNKANNKTLHKLAKVLDTSFEQLEIRAQK